MTASDEWGCSASADAEMSSDGSGSAAAVSAYSVIVGGVVAYISGSCAVVSSVGVM